MSNNLPPIPQGYKYGGQLKDYDGEVTGLTFDTDLAAWTTEGEYFGMKKHPTEVSADWHIAVPVDAEVPAIPADELSKFPTTETTAWFERDMHSLTPVRRKMEDMERRLGAARDLLACINSSQILSGEVHAKITQTLKLTAPKV